MPRTTSEPFINVTVQRIELDVEGNEINVVDRWGYVYKRLSLVAMDIVPYFEYAPNIVNMISIFGIADAIKETATAWIIEKYGGVQQPNGDVIL